MTCRKSLYVLLLAVLSFGFAESAWGCSYQRVNDAYSEEVCTQTGDCYTWYHPAEYAWVCPSGGGGTGGTGSPQPPSPEPDPAPPEHIPDPQIEIQGASDENPHAVGFYLAVNSDVKIVILHYNYQEYNWSDWGYIEGPSLAYLGPSTQITIQGCTADRSICHNDYALISKPIRNPNAEGELALSYLDSVGGYPVPVSRNYHRVTRGQAREVVYSCPTLGQRNGRYQYTRATDTLEWNNAGVPLWAPTFSLSTGGAWSMQSCQVQSISSYSNNLDQCVNLIAFSSDGNATVTLGSVSVDTGQGIAPAAAFGATTMHLIP